MKTLTNNDLINAAAQLGVEVATIRAVDEVESNGKGFYSNGNIVLRFETAVFKRYTGIAVSGSNQAAYDNADARNPTAAMLSTSWGRYQIMGFNYQVCGYKSVGDFVAGMKTGEQAQINAFVQFVKNNGIADELQRHDWAGFAYRYNGAGYKANNYDVKLAIAYAKYKGLVLPATADPIKKKVLIDGNTIVALFALCVLGAAAYYAVDGKWQTMWSYAKFRTKRLIPQ